MTLSAPAFGGHLPQIRSEYPNNNLNYLAYLGEAG